MDEPESRGLLQVVVQVVQPHALGGVEGRVVRLPRRVPPQQLLAQVVLRQGDEESEALATCITQHRAGHPA